MYPEKCCAAAHRRCGRTAWSRADRRMAQLHIHVAFGDGVASAVVRTSSQLKSAVEQVLPLELKVLHPAVGGAHPGVSLPPVPWRVQRRGAREEE